MQIDRPSRESRGASVLETTRVRSGGGFSGNHGCCCDEQSSQFHRCWVVTAVAATASVAGSHVSPQVRSNPKATASVRCLCNMPWPGSRSARGVASRTTRIVSRGLAPFAGKGRASARAATGKGCSTSVDVLRRSVRVSRWWLAIGDHLGRKLEIAPGFGTTWQGVSRAGRVRDCVVRARVLIVKTDSRGAH